MPKKFNGSTDDLEKLLTSMYSNVYIDKSKPQISLQAKTQSGTILNFFFAYENAASAKSTPF